MTDSEIIQKLNSNYRENLSILGKLRLEFQNKLNISGSLRVYKRKNQFYYYLISKKGDTNGTYLSKTNEELIKKLCQRDYNKEATKLLCKNNKAIRRFVKQYTPEPLEVSFQLQHPGKKNNISTAQPTNEQFIEKWKNRSYHKKTFSAEFPTHFSAGGQRLRSKSEVIIANLLEQHNIPYIYELPFKASQTITLHPDFTCLNPRTRQEFLWEHFGLMDDPEYAAQAVYKLKLYENKSYFPGKNLILTFEVMEQPLQTKSVELLINNFLK